MIPCLLLSWAGLLSANDVVQGIAYPQHDIELSASVDDVVVEVLAQEGERVAKGDVIVRYNHTKEDLTVEQSRLQKDKLEADYKNAKELADQKIYTTDRVDELRYLSQKASIDLQIAEALRKDKEVVSPISGILVEKNIDVGERTPKGQVVCRVIDPSALFLHFYVSTSLLNQIQEGSSYKVQFPEVSDEVFQATVSYISPEIDARSGLFKVRLLFDNRSNKIKAGVRVLTEFAR